MMNAPCFITELLDQLSKDIEEPVKRLGTLDFPVGLAYECDVGGLRYIGDHLVTSHPEDALGEPGERIQPGCPWPFSTTNHLIAERTSAFPVLSTT